MPLGFVLSRYSALRSLNREAPARLVQESHERIVRQIRTQSPGKECSDAEEHERRERLEHHKECYVIEWTHRKQRKSDTPSLPIREAR
jgi:hypothetical protein